MQFDWMVQCFPGDGEHRDAPLLNSLDHDTTLHGVDTAVDVGLGGLWAPDHFMLGPRAEEYEVWTLLSALAERTDDVDIGTLVNSITYRNPALLAKMATTTDILSEGRVRLGMGIGWHDQEHEAYGFEYPDIKTRIEMLDEGIQIVRSMFTEESPSFEGEHFEISNALNEPKPVQDPHPPIAIGAAGPQMLRLTAKYADEWNIGVTGRHDGPPLEFKIEKFNEYVRDEGRDPDDIERSWLGHVLVCEDDKTVEEYCDRIFPLPWGEAASLEENQLSNAGDARENADFFIGTPSEVASQLEEVEALGFDRMQLFFLDYPSTDGMELFGDEVLPEFA